MPTLTTTQSPSAIALKEEFVDKVNSRTAHIGVIGLGYVGLPLALLFTEQGFPVTGFDVDRSKIDMLTSSRSYICRIPEADIALATSHGFQATADFERISSMDAVIICVPTPLTEYREPDLSFITQTVRSVVPYLKPGQLIVLESTTYPGTTAEIVVPLVEEGNGSELRVSRNEEQGGNVVFVAFSPEREDPGNNTVARSDIPKIVGGMDRYASEIAAELYGSIFRRTIPVSSTGVAEMTKLLENIYRCVNIALVNELKLLCLRMGIDIWEVIAAASTKPFGFQPFYPGPGLGGHCIPIDPFYLSWKAKEFDFATRFIELAGEINMAMPYHMVEFIAEALNARSKALKGARVMVLGVSYKKDIDDLRESPAITIIETLQKSGAVVGYNDPYFPRIGKGRKYDLQLECVPLQDIGQYDCVVILTDHSSYDYAQIVQDAQLIVDTRNATRGLSSTKIVRC
ncbi:nucleotide sugar dehydrogenase [Edaphobacter sp. HDX4]|uniref:nucleotide sugar dehydrogenase n=1 Tax=Edaphobacter sp. HDX4 TaxID=2794064 RepID=UPI002FE5CA7A